MSAKKFSTRKCRIEGLCSRIEIVALGGIGAHGLSLGGSTFELFLPYKLLGHTLPGVVIEGPLLVLTADLFEKGYAVIRKGKKVFHKIVLE